jgi:hypothetical protein
MPTRKEIQDTLAKSQEEIITYFQGLSPEDRERPCTASGVADAAPWRAKDHLAHFASNEHGVQMLLSGILANDLSMLGSMGKMSAEEMQAWRNQSNQTYVDAHHDDSMETIFSDIVDMRKQTLALLAQFTDEQLTAPAPALFGPGRTVGDVFVVNALHDAQHVTWVEEGFRQGV